MKVIELRKMLEGVDDNIEVLIPVNTDCFDGMFYRPCSCESGVIKMAANELTEEEMEKHENLGLPVPEKEAFLLAPHGYTEEKLGPHPQEN
jgi:hypothetical protein